MREKAEFSKLSPRPALIFFAFKGSIWPHSMTDLALERRTGLFSRSGYRRAYSSGPYVIWLPLAPLQQDIGKKSLDDPAPAKPSAGQPEGGKVIDR